MLFPAELHVDIEQIERTQNAITVCIGCVTKTAACPDYGLKVIGFIGSISAIPQTCQWSSKRFNGGTQCIPLRLEQRPDEGPSSLRRCPGTRCHSRCLACSVRIAFGRFPLEARPDFSEFL